MLSVVGVWLTAHNTLKAPKLTRGCERRTVLTMIIPNGCARYTQFCGYSVASTHTQTPLCITLEIICAKNEKKNPQIIHAVIN